MLHDALSVPEIVDGACAHEFLMEATKLASSQQLAGIGADLAGKHRLFVSTMEQAALAALDAAALDAVLARIFLVRRKRARIGAAWPMESWRAALRALLYGDEPAARRVTAFATRAAALPGLRAPLPRVLASELLHYARPEAGWLWTPWLFDEHTGGGALPLVLTQDVRLSGGGEAETYENVGRALAGVRARGGAEGFTRVAPEPWGTTVFLACVYTVYMFTVFRMRLSGEFNRILPELSEFTRRILGVHQPGPGASDV